MNTPGKPTLFIFSGLPASGKSTLAKFLARELKAAYLRIDTIEQGLRDLCKIDVQGEGYKLAYRIVEDNLKLNISVVADSCNPVNLTRDEWEDVARSSNSDFVNIEVICSDKTEHKNRADLRKPEITNLKLPTWENIEKREYHIWKKDRIIIDTAGKSIHECEIELTEKIHEYTLQKYRNRP
ncbi:MAG TPA: AAA family ATPase [Chitinispirillaceae bacterium]|jgi:predicted kinase|nr:AAA family ATPase [Chitinispirillaceae bacterium]